MADSDQTREEDLRRLLTDAIEVQLAALRAGISFWTEWIEQTSEFVQSATTSLATINSDDQHTKDVLLELVDAGRASVRAMTEIPRHTANKFIEELDKIEKEKQESTPPASLRRRAAATGSKKSASSGSRRKRAGRVKA